MSIHVDLVAVSPTWSVRQVGPTFHLMTTSGFLLVCHHQLMLCLQQWHYEDAFQMANDYVICIAVSILACTINERLENVQEFADLVIFFYVEDFQYYNSCLCSRWPSPNLNSNSSFALACTCTSYSANSSHASSTNKEGTWRVCRWGGERINTRGHLWREASQKQSLQCVHTAHVQTLLCLVQLYSYMVMPYTCLEKIVKTDGSLMRPLPISGYSADPCAHNIHTHAHYVSIFYYAKLRTFTS